MAPQNSPKCKCGQPATGFATPVVIIKNKKIKQDGETIFFCRNHPEKPQVRIID